MGFFFLFVLKVYNYLFCVQHLKILAYSVTFSLSTQQFTRSKYHLFSYIYYYFIQYLTLHLFEIK